MKSHLSDDELRMVTGGNAPEDPKPRGGGLVEREVGRIQRDLPFPATRTDGVNEWNRRIQDYHQQQRNPNRYFDWLRKQPIG